MVFSFLPKIVHFISKNAILCLFLKNVSPSNRVICFILKNLHFPLLDLNLGFHRQQLDLQNEAIHAHVSAES